MFEGTASDVHTLSNRKFTLEMLFIIMAKTIEAAGSRLQNIYRYIDFSDRVAKIGMFCRRFVVLFCYADRKIDMFRVSPGRQLAPLTEYEYALTKGITLAHVQ